MLKGDFPSEYSTIIGSGRDICDQIEMVKKAAKLEEVLNKVSEEIKKLLNEIGHLKRINILQQSYFLYDHSKLLNLFRMGEGDVGVTDGVWSGGCGWVAKKPPYQFSPCNFYKRGN